MNRAQRREAAKGEKAQRRKEKMSNVNPGQGQAQIGDSIVVTQTDLLAQIGALTMEVTVLKNHLNQAQSLNFQLQEQLGVMLAEKAGAEEVQKGPAEDSAAKQEPTLLVPKGMRDGEAPADAPSGQSAPD